ncbi:MAG: hypothetical protein KIT73_20180, partial [Burkholderiales bacterium]|nr:hypothetical protein [Burkholderiales bacterium]
MAELTNPTDIARETLKLLAVQRIPPTPQNYQRLYHEISRTQPPENGVSARLIGILRELSSRNPEDTALTGLVRAVERHDWEDVSRDLQRLCERATGYTTTEWASLIRDLVRQLELPHRGITAARKREGLERLLTGSSGSEVPLPQRMRALIRSWSDAGASAMADTQAGQAGAVPPTGQTLSGGTPSPLATHGASKMVVEIRDLLASTLENGVGPRLDRYSDVQSELVVLAQKIREASMPEDWSRIAALLKQFWIKIELRLEPEEEILDNLLRLLGLMVNNLGELVDDDQWVNGQVAVLRELINRPMDLRAVREAERGFKEVIYNQASLKASLREAKST